MPGLYAPGPRQMYDVKAAGFKPDAYIGRRCAVDEKAATVPGQYRQRTQDADVEHNGTPRGAVGPIETMLATMPQVEPSAFR